MNNGIRLTLTVLLGVAVLFGAFAAASNDFAYGSQSALAAAVSLFNSGPTVSISRNTNSPSGQLIPGRSQVLAVFDVKGANLSGVAHVTELPVNVATYFNGKRLPMDNFVLVYKYCVPKGNIYAYGYKYGYSGVFCSGVTLTPSSVTKTEGSFLSGIGYKVTFSGIDLPVYADQTSGVITVLGNAYYPADNGKAVAKVRALIPSAVAQGNVCNTIYYGNKRNRYGYVRCTPHQISTNVFLAFGNMLTVARSYGYNTTGKPTDPSRPPIIEPPTVVPPQTAPVLPDGSTTSGGTQTGDTGTTPTVTTPTPKVPKLPPEKNTSPRGGTDFQLETP